MHVVFQQTLDPHTVWEARYLQSGEHLATLAAQPDGTVHVRGIAAPYDFLAPDLTRAQQWMSALFEPQPLVLRPLTPFEIARLESVIANEAQCERGGRPFSDYDLEQEGRYILGVGHYHAGYDAGTV